MSKKTINLGPSKRFQESETKLDEWVEASKRAEDALSPNTRDEDTKTVQFVRTTVSMPSELHRMIRTEAFKQGVTMNELLLNIIEKAI